MDDQKKNELMQSIASMRQQNAQQNSAPTQQNTIDNTTIKFQDGYYEEVPNTPEQNNIQQNFSVDQNQYNNTQMNNPQGFNSAPVNNGEVEDGGKRKMTPEKKKRVISTVVSIILVIVGVIIGIVSSMPKEQVFTKQEMQITLTDEFIEDTSVFGCIVAYKSTDMAILVTKQPFSELEEYEIVVDGVQDYLEFLSEISDVNSLVLLDATANAYYVDYTDTASGEEYYYRAYAFETQSAFWVFEFTCKKSEKSNLTDDMIKYASTITFTDAIAA